MYTVWLNDTMQSSRVEVMTIMVMFFVSLNHVHCMLQFYKNAPDSMGYIFCTKDPFLNKSGKGPKQRGENTTHRMYYASFIVYFSSIFLPLTRTCEATQMFWITSEVSINMESKKEGGRSVFVSHKC